MKKFEEVQRSLIEEPKSWLITGVSGFIGSNLLEQLLKLNQRAIGLDNFSTGKESNLLEVENIVSSKQWKNFSFIEGDITNPLIYERNVLSNVDYVLHQAALGSVPRSISDPIATNNANIDGFLNLIEASRKEKVKKFIYASSSSVYGDEESLPKKEEIIGNPLSPYAVSKLTNELYAKAYAQNYKFSSIGLRYFNVYGKRQDPYGSYAAVIPKWTLSMLKDEEIKIYGDGNTSRDFCFIDNVVQMNILAATSSINGSQVFNVALGNRISLNELYDLIKQALIDLGKEVKSLPIYTDFRDGDVRHSQADISKAKEVLDYSPEVSIKEGIPRSVEWYINNLN